MLRALLIVALLAVSPFARSQQPAPDLIISGMSPVGLSLQTISGLPAVERDVTFETSKGSQTRRYKGVMVWDVLRTKTLLSSLKLGEQLRKTVLVNAKDGYGIAFSIGEIHPDFGNAPLILVTEIDGKPLDGGWRIVMPGDRRGARAVYDVVRIELR